MNFNQVKKIADAVLYEGYILYPYRASAIKNHRRFSFGTLYPEGNDSGEPSSFRTQCLVTGESPIVDISVRFLHLLNREVLELETPVRGVPQDCELDGRLVAGLEVDGTLHQTWQEAIEREVTDPQLKLSELITDAQHTWFSFCLATDVDPLVDHDGRCVGAVRRSQSSIQGQMSTSCERVGDRVFKLTVDVQNDSVSPVQAHIHGDGRLNQVFSSTHILLGVEDGEFVSLIDPPDQFIDAVADCQNIGVWPVLAGDEGDRGCMLASPIILYDYPQIAPESGGDFFDGTEIDEMLTLRVMTMTDREKAEMRTIDERARQILERTESMSSAQMMNLHGVSKVADR